jgi:Ca2+-transporting ATPase
MISLDEIVNLPPDEVPAAIGVDGKNGLPSDEVAHRAATYGQNALEPVKRSVWKVYFAPVFENALVIVFLIATVTMVVINAAIGITSSGPLINFVLVMVNVPIVMIQQAKAQKSLDTLRHMVKTETKVIRDGKMVVIDSKNVVPGDVIVLHEGDKIAADARLIEANSLMVDESSITGESLPVSKDPALMYSCKPRVVDMHNCVFCGTFVTGGNGKAIVCAIGENTEIGRISAHLGATINEEVVPLQRKVNKFAYYLGLTVLVLFAASLVFNTIKGTSDFPRDFSHLLELALKAIPINIVLLSVIILITGGYDMAKHGFISRNLAAVESMGRISVLLTDKTGTITENALTVKHVWVSGTIFNVTGAGYATEGHIEADGISIYVPDYASLREVIMAGLLNSNAEIYQETYTTAGKQVISIPKVIGDPIEGAIEILAKKAGIGAETKDGLVNLKEYPFDSALKRMTKVWSGGEQPPVAFTKGAPEQLLAESTGTVEADGSTVPMDGATRDTIASEINTWSGQGFKLLGIAKRVLEEGYDPSLPREDVEREFTFLGLLVIQDPPREGIKQAVEECARASVRVVMITGDSELTGASIAKAVGILREGYRSSQGEDVATMGDEEFFKTAVFARATPRDKLVIVERYQDQGHVVAVTGDGVNDALALGMADVGLAMGIAGTDVAKEAADILISDDTFTTIKQGIQEGRALFAKIRAMIYYFVFVNLAEAIVYVGFTFLNKNFELYDLNLQIYLLYAITHALPPLGLSFDAAPRGVMDEKPRDGEEIFSRPYLRMLAINVACLIFTLVISGLVVYNTFLHIDPAMLAKFNANPNDVAAVSQINAILAKPRSISLVSVFIVEIGSVFCIRRPNEPVYRTIRRSDIGWLLVVLCALSMAGLLAAVYLSPTVGFFRTGLWLAPFGAAGWLFVVVLSLPSFVFVELYKYHVRARKEFF